MQHNSKQQSNVGCKLVFELWWYCPLPSTGISVVCGISTYITEPALTKNTDNYWHCFHPGLSPFFPSIHLKHI